MSLTEDIGISHVHKIVAKMGFFFREQPKHDFGIDVQIETSEQGKGIGRLIALQIKSGDSYIRHDKENNIVYYSDNRHIHYWFNHSLPVLLIIYSPKKDIAWWIDVKSYINENQKILEQKPFVIRIPSTSIFTSQLQQSLYEIAKKSEPISASHQNGVDKQFFRAEQYYLEGNKFRESGDLENALHSYNEAIKLDVNYTVAINNRGHIHRLMGNLDDAISDYNKAIRLDPLLAIAYNNRGFVKQKRDDWKGALTDYNHAITLQPSLDLPYINRAKIRENTFDWEGALEDYNQALLLNPTQEITYNNRGLVYYELGDISSAIEDFDTAIEINPKHGEAYTNRSLIHFFKNDIEAVIHDCTMAIRFDPDIAYAYNSRALAYIHQGELSKALHDCKRALQLDPTLSEAHNNKGLVELKLAKYQRAISSFTRSIKIEPTSISYSNLGYAYLLNEEVNKAIQACTFAIKLNPSNAEAYWYRYQAKQKNGDRRGANKDKQEYLQLTKLK